MKLLVINGVNLNLTGRREQGVYGAETLEEINDYLKEYAESRGAQVTFFQSNLEGEICTALQKADGMYEGIVLNAGVPVVEVHMSNVHARETFREKSVLTQVCKGEILGFGKNSYRLALESFLI